MSDEGFALDAQALTLRTALAYQGEPYEGFALFLEAENVSAVGSDLYNNWRPPHRGLRPATARAQVAPLGPSVAS